MDVDAIARAVFPALLPQPYETLFLRACLLRERRAQEAWQRYCREAMAAGALAQDAVVFGPMAPLLYASAKRNGLPVHKTGLTYLRSAYLNEQLREGVYTGILSNVVAILERSGIPVILSGAASLARTAYAEPALRHCHDVELLVARQHVPRVRGLLLPCGFALSGSPRPIKADVLLLHSSGLPLKVVHRLRAGRRWRTLPEIWARCPRDADLNVRLLDAADSLVAVCLRGILGPDRQPAQWAADAWQLITAAPALDWDEAFAAVRRSPYAFPLCLALEYLERELDAHIPASALHRFRAAASAPQRPRFAHKALLETLAHDRIDWKLVARMKGAWRNRFRVVHWMLFPPATYLRRIPGPDGSAPPFRVYLARLARSAGDGLRTLRRRLYESRAMRRYLFSPPSRGE